MAKINWTEKLKSARGWGGQIYLFGFNCTNKSKSTRIRAQDTLIWSIWIYLLEFIYLDWFGVICWQKLTVRKNWKVHAHTGRRRTYWSGLSGTSHPQMHNALKNFQRPEAKIWIRFKLQYSLYSSNNKLVWTFRFHILCHVRWFGSSLGRSWKSEQGGILVAAKAL